MLRQPPSNPADAAMVAQVYDHRSGSRLPTAYARVLGRYALAPVPGRDHDLSVPSAEDEERWLQSLIDEEATDPTDPAWRDWLHALFVDRGTLPTDRVLKLAEEALLTRAREAGKLVEADFAGTTKQVADITAGVHYGSARVVVNGEVANGVGIMSFDRTELLVEVADAAQEIIMDDSWVWPECPQHNSGLHPELVGGEAVWTCRVGRHTVARIGQLAAVAPRSAKAASRLERRRNRR